MKNNPLQHQPLCPTILDHKSNRNKSSLMIWIKCSTINLLLIDLLLRQISHSKDNMQVFNNRMRLQFLLWTLSKIYGRKNMREWLFEVCMKILGGENSFWKFKNLYCQNTFSKRYHFLHKHWWKDIIFQKHFCCNEHC